MSVYIEGMAMPKEPDEMIEIAIYGDGKVIQTGESWRNPSDGKTYYTTTTPEKHFLAEKTPEHGRLIDADALTIILSKVIDINASIEQRNEATDQERRCLWWFEQQIGIAPTVIEAEGGDAQ